MSDVAACKTPVADAPTSFMPAKLSIVTASLTPNVPKISVLPFPNTLNSSSVFAALLTSLIKSGDGKSSNSNNNYLLSISYT